ncbi:hypothetical protein CVIRNUC_001574 [Coccomyxa viridis]|uniref:Cytochrome P450 n=1 Tax=Coccomyxa viridis TaxID=1274662 RepID=A0AAV1HUF6_9CHLO|nr:hypothetical protein CVIRNUC_001574 [Coccomyxa viridis]
MKRNRHVRLDDVVQQIEWHKGDVPVWGALFVIGLCAATAFLVNAAVSPKTANPLLVVLCSIYASLGAVTAIREVRSFRRQARMLAGLPGPQTRHVLGFTDILTSKEPHRLLLDMAERYGPIFSFRVIHLHLVCITDPAVAMDMLKSPYVDKVRFLYSFLDPFLMGTNMLTGHTDKHWKAVRKGVAPAFSAQHMRSALHSVVECCGALARYMEVQGPRKAMDVDELLLRESMDVIGRFGFQKDMGAIASLWRPESEANHNVRALLESTEEVVARTKTFMRWWQLWRPDVVAGWVTLGRFKNIIRDLLEHMKSTKLEPGTFADLLMKTKDPRTKQLLSDKQLLPEIAALFFAGIDTTGHTGSFCLFLLSQHPEVEAKVVQELQRLGLCASVQRPEPRQLAYADLAELAYLQAVVKETLRMFPPVAIGQARLVSADLKLAGGFCLPAGAAALVPHHAMHSTSFNWDKPNEFLPERWLVPGAEYAVSKKQQMANGDISADDAHASSAALLEDTEGDNRQPKRYIPFAEGPRNCVGQSLAKVSLVATLAVLLSQFSFKLADDMGGAEGVRRAERYALVNGIAGGLRMHAIPRLAQQKEE